MLIINANVTLRSVFTWDNIKWQNCPSFTTNGATITNNTFVNTKVTVASPAQAALISDSSFTKTTGTQHGIEIGGTAANITLDGLTFTGYAVSNGSTGNEAIYVNIASGSMTISIVGGGSVPSIRTAGATVTVTASVTLTVSGLQTGSDVVIYEAGTTTVLDSVDANGTSTWDYVYDAADAGNDIDIGVFKAGYRPFYIRTYTLPATDATVPVAQDVDLYYLT
jgi:hypothetical protein